jgi:hypothetical protein
LILAGLLGLAGSTLGLALLFEPAVRWYYQLAWWSYILLADGINRRLSGRSLIRDRPLGFLWLCALSVAWWCVFEAINLRLGNWYYVMDEPQRAVRWAGGVVAFATVLPGIVVTLSLLQNLGWPRSVPVRPLRWTRARERVCLMVGALFFVLPLLWPDAFFPLTWGSFALLLEPWNRAHARRSFLRDLEAGEAAPVVRTLAAGLVCGLLWELWNYWARTKWMYTVPGFEEWRLFEMPLMGFLGFPPFALECLVVIRFVQAVGERVAARGRMAARAGAAAVLVLAVAFTGGVFVAADPVTIDSFYVPVAAATVLPEEGRLRLHALGLTSQEKLLRALGEARHRADWSARSGLTEAELAEVHERAALVAHAGMGDQRARQLERVGIRDRAALRGWTAPALAAVLRAQGETPRDRFLERRIRVWLRSLPDPAPPPR